MAERGESTTLFVLKGDALVSISTLSFNLKTGEYRNLSTTDGMNHIFVSAAVLPVQRSSSAEHRTTFLFGFSFWFFFWVFSFGFFFWFFFWFFLLVFSFGFFFWFFLLVFSFGFFFWFFLLVFSFGFFLLVFFFWFFSFGFFLLFFSFVFFFFFFLSFVFVLGFWHWRSQTIDRS